MSEKQSPFVDTIFLLRKEEQLVLYTDDFKISKNEETEIADYLETEFEKERLNFLDSTIAFHKEAAVWAAKILYHSAQLYLIRNNTAKDLPKLISDFSDSNSLSAKLSTDLTLRFLPQIVASLRHIDSGDLLIGRLENILKTFHFSAIGVDLDFQKIDWEKELENSTFRKLYLERIVEKKNYFLANIPYINNLLIAEFGLYKENYWRELEAVKNIDDK